LSRIFARTLREPPAGIDLAANRLALRAGLIRSLAPTTTAYLPLGKQALDRLTDLVRAEWTAAGGQEVVLPLVQPVELWRRSGRYDALRTEMTRFRDDANHDLAVGMGHEEAVVELARSEINSHHQLPVFLFEEGDRISRRPQARAGLLAMAASRVLQGYSLHSDETDAAALYERLGEAFGNIFGHCDLAPLRVQAGIGPSEQGKAHRWLLPHDAGDETFVRCDGCEYAATLSGATMAEPEVQQAAELPLEEVATPGAETIAALAEFLGVPTHSTLKVVFYTVQGRVVCVAMRGDRSVDEAKLASVLGRPDFYPSTESELAAVGTVGGYGSPMGLQGARVIVDRTVAAARNLVAGANRAGYHVLNVNTPRDFAIDMVADLAQVQDGDECPHCRDRLSLHSGVGLATAALRGSSLSEALDVTFLNEQGRSDPLHLGSYSLGLDRLLLAVLETHHDQDGIIWPPACAPYDVHLLGLNLNKPEVLDHAEGLYEQLRERGLRVLYDDRDASAGVKFKDADLIGLPLRLTVSSRSLKQGGVEVKWRARPERDVLSLEALQAELERLVSLEG
jgi:prolyl-tRNA synthetase